MILNVYKIKKMEKSTETITQQLIYLKKTLKKKRKSEIWQQTIQYYRNNQTSISNYHILKIIKIIMKPLKSSVLKNCHFLSKLSKLYYQSGGDDPKFNGQIRDQIQSINTKIRAMENLLECYTLALENFMTASNPSYFNMIFRKNYHAKHPTKQLLFQPVAVTHQKSYPKQIIEHELSGYLKFVSEFSIVYCTSILCYQDQNTIIRCFKQTDRALYEIFNSSHIFTTKKIMYELLKLNFLMKFQSSGQCTLSNSHNKSGITKIPSSVGICLVNKIMQYEQIHVQYNFPLQLIHSLYKNYKKWQQPRIKNSFILILRYMYMISLNISNKNLLIGHKMNQFVDQTKRNYSIQAEIFILMKQILNLNKYIHINLSNQFAKISLEFISSIVDGYELKLSEKQKLNDFIFRYFDFQQIRTMGQSLPRKQSIKQNNNVVITKKQEQNRNKNRVISLNNRNSKKSIFLNRGSQKIQVGSLKTMGNKISKLFKQFGSPFNYIEESESDEENALAREFQQKRRDQIQNAERKLRGNKMKDNPANKMSHEKSYMQIEEVNKKLDNLGEKTARLRSFSETALKKLQKRRTQNIQQDRLQKTNIIFNSYENYQLQYNLLQKFHRIQPTVNDKLTYLKGSTKLPVLQKHNEQPSKLHKQYQPILLSDKYDKMSQMILLTNTNKQKNLNNI